MLHVQFTTDGIPAWIGPEPIPGSEPVEGLDLEFLVAHMRTPEGEWVPRPPPPPLTEEQLAELARIDAENQARADAEWKRWVDEEVARRAQPDALLRAMGRITIAELTQRVAAIRLEVEAGN